jgi:hypothetical protein
MPDSIHSTYIGGSLAFYQGHRHRIVGAIGDGVTWYSFQPQFANEGTTDPTGWTATVVEVGTGTSEWNAANGERGTSTITTAANENDGYSAQLIGEQFKLDAGNFVYFRLKAQLDKATQSDFFAGLAITDTAILAGVSDRIGFEKLDGSTALSFAAEKDSTQTLTTGLLTVEDGTDFDLEFVWDGRDLTLYSYVNGAYASEQTVTTNVPNDEELRLSIEVLSGAAGVAVMTASKFIVCQIPLD